MALPHARSINQLFILGTLLACSPLIIGMAWSVYHVQQLYARSETLVARSLELGRESEKLSGQIDELERNARQYLVVGTENVFALYRQRHSRAEETIDWLGRLVVDDDTREVIDEIRRANSSLLARLNGEASSVDADAIGEDFLALRNHTERLKALAAENIRVQLESLRGTSNDARRISYLVGAAAFAAMAVLLILSAVWITRPIRNLDTSIRRLGAGNLNESIDIAGPEDVSRLSDRLDWLRRRIIEVDQGKDQFMREMSHQLKTPLASIREGTELLLDGAVSASPNTQREVLEILHQNSLELQRMLENLLGFSAWRTNPSQVNRETVKLGALIGSIVERYGIVALSRYIALRVDCPDDLEVMADRAKMRVIVDNLLSNAIKFTPAGGDIRIVAERADGGFTLDVIDDGPGVPESEKDVIFDLFYQGRHTSEQLRGTGVGLALVKAYVESQGGSIKIVPENEPKGHFRVFIPQP